MHSKQPGPALTLELKIDPDPCLVNGPPGPAFILELRIDSRTRAPFNSTAAILVKYVENLKKKTCKKKLKIEN